MPTVNTITVTFGRKIAPKAYESMDASATLTLDFDEDEAAKSLPEEIQRGLEIVKIEVLKILNIAEKPKVTTPKEARVAIEKVNQKVKPASKPKGVPEPKSEVTDETPPTEYSQSDVMKAITGAIDALKKVGVANGAERVSTIVKAYLPDGKPPFSATRIPATSRGGFIKDVNALKKVAK